MHTPSEAIAEIAARIDARTPVERIALRRACGRCLAETVVSDVDLPPFEKSAMDGFALRAAELPQGGALECVGESRAGAPFAGSLAPGSCVEIYTGAELPRECDAVVVVERSRRAGTRIELEGPVKAGQNVNHRAEVLARGRTVFEPPRRLSAVDLAVLATVGKAELAVRRKPRVSVLTTGDELVPVERVPGPGQIREGNTFALAAALERAGAELVELGIVADEPAALRAAFERALAQSDVLVTTGGVSMGRYDLVGAALEALGVAPLLHKVAIKPGKPIWFGMYGQKPVLGLPGNPVSSLLGFHLFVRPVLARLEGAPEEEAREQLRLGRWAAAPPKPDERQNNVPVRLREAADGVIELEPIPYKGSADIAGLCAAEGFAVIPAGRSVERGERIHYRPLPRA